MFRFAWPSNPLRQTVARWRKLSNLTEMLDYQALFFNSHSDQSRNCGLTLDVIKFIVYHRILIFLSNVATDLFCSAVWCHFTIFVWGKLIEWNATFVSQTVQNCWCLSGHVYIFWNSFITFPVQLWKKWTLATETLSLWHLMKPNWSYIAFSVFRASVLSLYTCNLIIICILRPVQTTPLHVCTIASVIR